MQKQDRVTFLVDPDDQKMIAALADRLRRNKSDAIRLVIRRAFMQMMIPGLGDQIYPLPKNQGAADEK